MFLFITKLLKQASQKHKEFKQDLVKFYVIIEVKSIVVFMLCFHVEVTFKAVNVTFFTKHNARGDDQRIPLKK